MLWFGQLLPSLRSHHCPDQADASNVRMVMAYRSLAAPQLQLELFPELSRMLRCWSTTEDSLMHPAFVLYVRPMSTE